MIGRRLKLSRSAAKLSLRELEERIGNLVSAQAIGRYERNEMMPSSKVLIALAKALNVTESYLLGDAEIHLEGVEFRKQKLDAKRDEEQISAVLLQQVEGYLEIEDLLRVDSLNWNKPRGVPFPIKELANAEAVAQTMRAEWKLGLDSIPNLAEFFEEQGIKVIAVPLHPKISGSMGWVQRKNQEPVPIIIINADHPGERQRFTLAHELGHMVMDVPALLDAEIASHRFAGAFIVPAEILWIEIGRQRTTLSMGELLYLKKLLGISVQALVMRCKDLGIISESTCKHLFIEISKRGWRKAEPEALPSEHPTRLKRLCFRAVVEQALSIERAAELLGVPTSQLSEEMNGQIEE